MCGAGAFAWEWRTRGEENTMRRVLQVCGVAAVLASMVGVHVPATGAQGIVSGITVPPIPVVTSGMPVGVAGMIPTIPSIPIISGINVGMAGTGFGGERSVTYKESRTSEPATIVLSE